MSVGPSLMLINLAVAVDGEGHSDEASSVDSNLASVSHGMLTHQHAME